MFKLNPYLESVIVGLLLSDAYIQHNRSTTSSFAGDHTNTNLSQLCWLFFLKTYQILSPIILTMPVFKKRKRKETMNYSLTF